MNATATPAVLEGAAAEKSDAAQRVPTTKAEAALLTWEDLEKRWMPPMADPKQRKQWLQRMARRWRLSPLRGTRGAGARFRLVDVIKAEAYAAGERRR